MKRTLRLAILTFAVSLAVFAPVAGASHDSPNAGADIIGAQAIGDQATSTLDVTLEFESKTQRGLSYTLTVYDDAFGGSPIVTLTQGGNGADSLAFNDIAIESWSCGDPNTAGDETGDHAVYFVATASAGGHVFDVAPDEGRVEADFCFAPSDIGFD